MLISTILGAITGLLGNVVGGWLKLKNSKLEIENTKIKNQHELDMVKAESDAMILEAKSNIKIEQAKVEGAIEIEDSKAYMQSQKEGNKNLFSNKWIDALLKIEGKWKIITVPIACIVATMFGAVDFLRMLIRPITTIYLCVCTTWITWMAWEIMQKNQVSLSSIQAVTIFSEVTNTVIYLTVSCLLWWYGDRRMEKSLSKMNNLDVNKMEEKINI